MVYDKFRTQKETKKKNEEQILKSLYEKPKTFTELKEETHLSQMGLTNVLKRLKSENIIKKDIKEDMTVYVLTEKGNKEAENLWHIYFELDYLKENKASYIHGTPNSFVSFDLIMLNKDHEHLHDNILSIIPNPYEFNNYIMENLFKKAKEKNLNMVYNSNEGKYMLSFEFDLKKLMDFFNKIKIFIDDIKKGINVLNDDKLDITKNKKIDRIDVLYSLVLYSNYFTTDDEEFKKNLIKYLQSFDNKERTEEIFGISYEVLNQLIEDIRNGIDPLKDNKISNKLVEEKGDTTYNYIDNYLKIALLYKLNDKPTFDLIQKYDNSIED